MYARNLVLNTSDIYPQSSSTGCINEGSDWHGDNYKLYTDFQQMSRSL